MAKKKRELNPKQKLFCEIYTSAGEFFGNGVQSYIEAYDINIKEKGAYESAKQCAHRLLTNVDILAYIDTLIDENGLNDQYVDKQLLFLISQQADLRVKRSAISEYNKLRQRIIEKQEINVTGQPYNPEFTPNGKETSQ